MNMTDFFIIISCVTVFLSVGYLIGHAIGFSTGKKRGIDDEWCRQHFARLAADRARRGPDGKFKAKDSA
jgi:hypothetical protein